jgi:hypothetical protein
MLLIVRKTHIFHPVKISSKYLAWLRNYYAANLSWQNVTNLAVYSSSRTLFALGSDSIIKLLIVCQLTVYII